MSIDIVIVLVLLIQSFVEQFFYRRLPGMLTHSLPAPHL